jgi:hypothetical protein
MFHLPPSSGRYFVYDATRVDDNFCPNVFSGDVAPEQRRWDLSVALHVRVKTDFAQSNLKFEDKYSLGNFCMCIFNMQVSR